MKCEMIRDLLPLYVDGLTSEESNKEIEKHLKSCKECRMYYQEMTGEIQNIVSISDEELQDVELIKKIKKKNRRKVIGFLSGGILVVGIVLFFAFSRMHSHVKFEDVQIHYGVRGDIVYFTIESKPGYELLVSGGTSGNDANLIILSERKIGGFQTDKMWWEAELGTEDDPCRWTIEFQDKTVVIENGKLAEEKRKSVK